MYYIPRNVSVCPHQVSHYATTFDASSRKYLHAVWLRSPMRIFFKLFYSITANV